MEKASVFAFDDYKEYLRALVEARGAAGKLSLSALARQTGYQRSFYSRVIHAELHLTPEGAYKVSQALRFSEEESSYFLWLVEKARAGDADYRRFASGKALDIKRARERAQKAPVARVSLEEDYFSLYLNSWSWTAVHLATAIPELQQPARISARFGFPIPQVSLMLKTLEERGLVREAEGRFVFAKGTVHISQDSPWAHFHNGNWRQKAMVSAQGGNNRSLHFTNVLTLSERDRELIRDKLLSWIEEVQKTAGPSEPEDMVCLNLDYFQV